MASYCITLFDTLENPSENDACFVCATKNLTLSKGSSYRISYTLSKDGSSVNLAGYSIRGTIKPSASSDVVFLNMTTANLLLRFDNNNSSILMVLPESFTRRMTTSTAVYDIELITPSTEITKIVTGLITFI